MPLRKTYQINNREQGKAAQRDQSYRSCLIALIIFFFMCLIIILASTPWKLQRQREYKDRYVERDEPQHYPQERTKEATVIFSKTTQRNSPTHRILLPTTRIIPKTVITSATENRPTEETNVITVDHSKKNVKGSRHFERYLEENKTSVNEVTSPTPKEDTERYSTMKEILKITEATEKSSILPRDIVTDDVIDNDAASTPSGPVRNAPTRYTTIVDIIKAIMASKSAEESASDSTDGYYNSDKSEVDIVINNVTTMPLLSTHSNDLAETVSEISVKQFQRIRIDDDVTSSTRPSFPTDFEESVTAEDSSDENNYSKNSRFEVTTSDITSARPNPEEDGDTKNSTSKHINYGESAATGHDATLINEAETRKSSPSTTHTPLMDGSFSHATVKREAEDVMNETTTIMKRYTNERYNMTSGEMEKHSISSTSNSINTITDFYNHTTSTATPMSYNETSLTSTARTTLVDEDTSVCETGHCKQIVSRMLSYMNHSADPCDDFYEYACGGFEANPQLTDEDRVRRSRNYQRIASQMLKEKRENVHSTFATYYDSCVQYERNMNFSERTRMARDALGNIGKFYIPATWSANNYTGFTDLFAQLILHHSALLFDVVPELDEFRPDGFTLRISPTTYESPFEAEYVEDPCFEENKFEAKGQYVDLDILYYKYKKCKTDTSEFKASIRKALTELNVFKDLNDSHLEWNMQSEYIENTVFVIDSVLMQKYFANFPSESEVRKAYLMNDYSKVSLEGLQSSSAFVNWTGLINSLTGMNVVTSEDIQVYFHAALTAGLRKLEEYAKENPMGLNNAIMALYAHRLYRELVLPKRDNVKDYCLHVATHLLQLEASNLYISSFTDHEIMQMDRTIETTFDQLKQTLSIKMQEAQWAKEQGRDELLRKIDNLKLALPVASYFKNIDSLYNEYNVSKITLDDDYFNNSMILLKRYRVLMYTELRRQVGSPKQIWTYYATPFQSKARVIYVLNLIVIPYGIVDWSLIDDELSFNYLLLATLGNSIAHQIAHHFDTNGIYYWNETRNTQDSLMFENEFTNSHFDDYVNCQKENLYQGPINMTLPFTDQTVSFRIPQLTLNERLSEIMGLRLAYDTLAPKSNAKRLPWIQLRIDQLFYLAYAQTYCTKMPFTSSYVSLYESGDLPSRIRVFVSASNDVFLGHAWDCPLGSQIVPNDVCSVFPYIETKEAAILAE